MLGAVLIEMRLVYLDAGPFALRDIHGDVRMAQQHPRILAVRRALRDTDARSHIHRLSVKVDGIFQNGLYHPSHRRSTPQIAAGEEDCELVPAQSSDLIGFPQGLPQTLRDRLQYEVARVVAERIVDELEPVQIHQQHCHWCSVPSIRFDRFRQLWR